MHDKPTRTDGGSEGGRPAFGQPTGFEGLKTVPISAQHRAADFKCSLSPRIEGFFTKEFEYYTRTNYTRVFVYSPADADNRILGYYTLSAAAISRKWLLGKHQRPKTNPPGLDPPMVRIGFLGRDENSPKGLGRALVIDAARRVSLADIGVWGIVLDAETDPLVKKVYEPMGFVLAVNPDNPGEVPPLLMYAALKSLLA